MWCGEFARAALAADLGAAGIEVPMGTELEIKRPSAGVAEQRLARGGSMTLVAIAHGISQKRLALISRGPEEDGGPEAVTVNVVQGGEPEDLVGRLGNRGAD